jgi:hypothetical protein
LNDLVAIIGTDQAREAFYQLAGEARPGGIEKKNPLPVASEPGLTPLH